MKNIAFTVYVYDKTSKLQTTKFFKMLREYLFHYETTTHKNIHLTSPYSVDTNIHYLKKIFLATTALLFRHSNNVIHYCFHQPVTSRQVAKGGGSEGQLPPHSS